MNLSARVPSALLVAGIIAFGVAAPAAPAQAAPIFCAKELSTYLTQNAALQTQNELTAQQLQKVKNEIQAQLDADNEISDSASQGLEWYLAPAGGANASKNASQAVGMLNKAYASDAVDSAARFAELAASITFTNSAANKSAADSYSTGQAQQALQTCLGK